MDLSGPYVAAVGGTAGVNPETAADLGFSSYFTTYIENRTVDFPSVVSAFSHLARSRIPGCCGSWRLGQSSRWRQGPLYLWNQRQPTRASSTRQVCFSHLTDFIRPALGCRRVSLTFDASSFKLEQLHDLTPPLSARASQSIFVFWRCCQLCWHYCT